MSRITRTAAVAGAGALVAALALPGQAVAADSAPTFARVATTTDRAAVDAEFFAGYVSALQQKKTVTGTYAVPTLDCGAVDEGIDTFVELASDGGANYVDGAVFSSCVGGEATHTAAFDTSTADGQVVIEEVVENGDKIKVTSEVVRGKIKVTMKNITQDWTAKDTFTGVTPDEASVLQYKIQVGGTPVEPLSADSKVTGVKVSGKDLKQTDPTKFTMVDENGDALIQPSKISKGTNFNFKYVG